MATKQPDEITCYQKTDYGYVFLRGTKQYGVMSGEHETVAQFLGISPSEDTVEFTETFVAPIPRPQDHFPPHIRVAKYGFGKAKS